MSAAAAVTLVLTVGVALVGYLLTYFYNLRLARRASTIDLLTHQLRDFYGPLYIATEAGEKAFRTLVGETLHRPDLLPSDGAPTGTELFGDACVLDEEARSEYRMWFEHVLCPLNDVREEIILHNAYLIREPRIPDCIKEFLAHASECKATVKRWAGGDLAVRAPVTRFPTGLLEYSRSNYNAVKG